MYSKNDYRYYLENRLIHSDDFLAHYGVLGMKWGQRKEAYIAKRTSNEAKIADYQKKLNTIGAQKRAAKAAKYQAKLSKIDKKAAKARAKLAKGKKISSGQMKKIAKAEKYREKIAKNSVKNDKYQMKINKLQTKNTKLNKKINKADYKIDRDKHISNTKSTLSKRQLEKNYNKTYKNNVKFMKRMGSTADTYKVNSIDDLGRVTSISPQWNSGPLENVNKKKPK